MRGRIENAQAGRGCLTDELRERYRPCTGTGYAMGPVELGLVPYLHHLAVNRKPLDRWAISAEEFVVLAGWEQHGWISVFGTDEEPVAVTKGFWDFMCSAQRFAPQPQRKPARARVHGYESAERSGKISRH